MGKHGKPHKPKPRLQKQCAQDREYSETTSFGLIPIEFDDQPGTIDYCNYQIQKRGII